MGIAASALSSGEETHDTPRPHPITPSSVCSAALRWTVIVSAAASETVDFIVDRKDLRRTDFVPGRQGDGTALEDGQVLVRIDRFAFTANNITYGVVGDAIHYWDFFPAPEGWGRIPVWGFGDVVRSRHPAVPAGERLFGYLPMSTHVVLQADHVTPRDLIDASPHRASLPPFYNQYTRVAADPSYTATHEGHIALFRPLFATGFLLDDFLAENAFFGARSVILSSASSKTALSLAFLLSQNRREQCEVVGLTSPANVDFVERTGYYGAVRPYHEIRALTADTPSVFVDFAGSPAFASAVHERFGDNLRYSSRVGITHWEDRARPGPLPGPASVFFFAPEQARKRLQDLGAAEFHRRLGTSMRQFLGSAAAWLRIVEDRGRTRVESVYRDMLEGKTDPAVGHIVSVLD
jgi:hypothetical protein